MAIVQAGEGGAYEVLFVEEWQQVFETMKPRSESSTKAVFTDSRGDKVTVFGTGLDSSHQNNIKGEVDHVVIEDNKGHMIFDVTDASASYADAYTTVQATYDYGIEDFLSLLERGNDTITGTNGSEEIPVGLNFGDDVVKARGGDDWMRASPGNKEYDGGSGIDMLAYHTYWWGSAPQKRGVDIDTAAGTAINPWNGHDTFKNVEMFRLSMQNDTASGSSRNEEFALLKGRDALDAKGGFDTINYSSDVSYDGNKGVTVNLDTGVAIDGFGTKDSLANVEAVIGTQFADVLTGTDDHNEITGGTGRDQLEGKGGSDTFVFSFGFDKDTIADFKVDGNRHDVIQIVDYGNIHNYHDVKSMISDDHGNAVIDFGGGDEITFIGVHAKDLSKADFDFG